jgi:hypothetical protein
VTDALDEAIARAERLLESPWLLDSVEEREFLEASLAYDREVRSRLQQRERAYLN